MHCLGCGYDLRHLPKNRCPECGRPLDPANPLTFRSPASLARRGRGPLRLAWITLTIYAGAFVALCFLGPDVKAPLSMFLQPILIVLTLASAVLAFTWALAVRARRVATLLIALVLIAFILGIHVPTYVWLLDEIATVRAITEDRIHAQRWQLTTPPCDPTIRRINQRGRRNASCSTRSRSVGMV